MNALSNTDCSNKVAGAIGFFTPFECTQMRIKTREVQKCAKRDYSEDCSFSSEDKQAWWEYLRTMLPKNYVLATRHKDKANDPILGDISTLNINDYFEVYGLPRVSTKDHQIYVNNTAAAKYMDESDYRKAREIYRLARQEPEFHDWRAYQFFHCQGECCAWCHKPADFRETEVDHIKPLIFFGENDPSNLVITHKACNRRKSGDTTGWNEAGTANAKNAKPSWIKPNIYDVLWRDIIAKAESKYSGDKSAETKPKANTAKKKFYYYAWAKKKFANAS